MGIFAVDIRQNKLGDADENAVDPYRIDRLWGSATVPLRRWRSGQRSPMRLEYQTKP